jgi:hypothetical protein
MTMSIPPRRYSRHVALASFNYDPTTFFEKVQCDALVEECNGLVIVNFQKIVVDYETTKCLHF